jgi:hypothetical protein
MHSSCNIPLNSDFMVLMTNGFTFFLIQKIWLVSQPLFSLGLNRIIWFHNTMESKVDHNFIFQDIKLIYSFIHLDKYLLSTYYDPPRNMIRKY